ncbi:hypothetical protein Ahia01_000552700 [Argonauta hians]
MRDSHNRPQPPLITASSFEYKMGMSLLNILCLVAVFVSCVHSLPKRNDHVITLRSLRQTGLSDSDSRALLQAYILGKLSNGEGAGNREADNSDYTTIKRKAFWRPMGYLPFDNHGGSGASSSNDNSPSGGSGSSVFRYG